MGLLKGLLGGNSPEVRSGNNEKSLNANNVSNPPISPQYERLNVWIESRIGRMDPSDPTLNARLERFLTEEGSKYPSPRGKLVFTPSGHDTIVTGDTKPFKGRLRRLGGRWDGKLKRWVFQGRSLSEADVENPSQLAGLKAYIEKMPYRKNLGGK
jgi:hypothetical protein